MQQLNLEIEDELRLRELIYENRNKVSNLKREELTIVKMLQTICRHMPEDCRTTYDDNDKRIRYCGLCEKKLTSVSYGIR